MLKNLDWLPAAPADFRERVSGLKKDASASDAGERLIVLANAVLDENQLNRLAVIAGALGKLGQVPRGLTGLRLGILGDGTLSLLVPALVGTALRHGLLLDVTEGAYNNAVQEAMDPFGLMRTKGLDMAIIATDRRILGLDAAAPSAEAAKSNVDDAIARLQMIVTTLQPAVSSAIFVQTIAPPVEPLFGSFDRVQAGSAFSMTAAFNRRLAEWAAEGGIVLIDIARLAGNVGLEAWDSPRHWHASKLSFNPEMTPVYADVVTRTVAAVSGKSRKCLVLDLDNTLWGGVIGDDGVDGIDIGQGSASGEAFLAIQRLALDLRNRGVVLAVCSKNELEVAKTPFAQHPEMLLREDHIAVFQANWTDKAANLKLIAETLNIGVDALVFLDDNPAERMQVRRELPQVAVPELPDDPALYPRILAAAGYFEAVAFSQEDRERAAFYQGNALRTAALQGSTDFDGYLKSLNMTCTIAPVDAVSRSRVAQLINKSNQFNLTTRRYSEREVADLQNDPTKHAIQIRLTDCFGDNGIISVIIADLGVEAWEIGTWLMSCRVLGRKVEEAALAHLAAAARQSKARYLVGRYIPSAKNAMVAAHYAKLGFTPVGDAADGSTTWRLDTLAFTPPDLPMRLKDEVRFSPRATA
jgi:FkbH-like protein